MRRSSRTELNRRLHFDDSGKDALKGLDPKVPTPGGSMLPLSASLAAPPSGPEGNSGNSGSSGKPKQPDAKPSSKAKQGRTHIYPCNISLKPKRYIFFWAVDFSTEHQ